MLSLNLSIVVKFVFVLLASIFSLLFNSLNGLNLFFFGYLSVKQKALKI